MGAEAAGLAHHLAQKAPPYPPCDATWNLLLHYHWMAQLPTGIDWILALSGMDHRNNNRCQTKRWWSQVVQENWIVWQKDRGWNSERCIDMYFRPYAVLHIDSKSSEHVILNISLVRSLRIGWVGALACVVNMVNIPRSIHVKLLVWTFRHTTLDCQHSCTLMLRSKL